MKMSRKKTGYVIHKTTDTSYQVARILSEHDSEDEAIDVLVKLLTKKITEKELLKNLE